MVSFISVFVMTLLSLSFAAGPVAKSQSVRRGIASAGCADSACLCEEVKKLSVTCNETLDKLSEGSEDVNRKLLRTTQNEIANKRRQIIEQGKSCVAMTIAETCFERSVKTITQKNPRRRDLKNENTSELLGFSSEVMMKLGNQPGRSPAANSR